MKETPFPKNSLNKEQIAKIPTPTLEEDTDMDYATNALIMNECYLTGVNLMPESKVEDAKTWVDENHK